MYISSRDTDKEYILNIHIFFCYIYDYQENEGKISFAYVTL